MDERSWEGLLSTAVAILDDLDEGLGAPEMAMGGGTVLMMRMHHRLSKDIDLFLHDAQWLFRLTPRLNDRVARMVRDYSEQANSVNWVSPSLPRCRGSAGTRWLDDGVVGRGSNGEGLLGEAMKEQPAGL